MRKGGDSHFVVRIQPGGGVFSPSSQWRKEEKEEEKVKVSIYQ